ncbi:hypothetical protein [Flavobacterium sp.]|uniref:hypothetical protein n=1 Tax=Flavobacterium sp. TaxID=239 RepID=UPI0037521D00
MKTLKDFSKNEANLKSISGGKIFVGNLFATEYQKPASDPDCCYVYNDWFADSNGNGQWDQSFETGGTYNPGGTYTCP